VKYSFGVVGSPPSVRTTTIVTVALASIRKAATPPIQQRPLQAGSTASASCVLPDCDSDM
jgi:hypothetical protein